MKTIGGSIWQYLGFRPTGDLGPLTFYTTRRGETVFFPKAPPLNPPSYLQTVQRNRFRTAAKTWKALPELERQNWEAVTRKAKLTINGYNLFVWYLLRDGEKTATAFAERYDIQLFPLNWSQDDRP